MVVPNPCDGLQVGAGVYRALIVCNWTYDADPESLPELRGPRADGPLLRHALTDSRTGVFTDANVEMLFDKTSTEILKATNVFFDQAQPDDVLLFYFSGHGRSRHQKLYLCARDTIGTLLLGTAVSNDALSGMIKESHARVTIVIVDCCHAGAFTLKGNALAEKLWAKGRFVLAATSTTELADDADKDGRPSPFTQALVNGLTHGARNDRTDGEIDLDDLYRYLCTALSHGPEPQRKFDGAGNICIARRHVPTPPVSTIDENTSESAKGAATGPAGTDLAREHIRGDDQASFLDETTTATWPSPHRIATFRAELRVDIARDMPEQLSATEFLHRAHLMRAGHLTRAGALLFGEDPTAVIPTARVQCTRVYGADIDAPMETSGLRGTIPEQIIRARDFVADLARRGEAPTEDSAIRQPVEVLPMVAVRGYRERSCASRLRTPWGVRKCARLRRPRRGRPRRDRQPRHLGKRGSARRRDAHPWRTAHCVTAA